MVEVFQFHLPCGGMTSVDVGHAAFEQTKAFAEGAVFGCRHCSRSCAMWWIARAESHKELMTLLETPRLPDSAGTQPGQ